MGAANDHSIAWGIARILAQSGASLAFTFQGEAQARRVRPLAESVGTKIVIPCDVENDDDLDVLFATLGHEWDSLDFVVHSLAYSDRNELKGRYVETSRANFSAHTQHLLLFFHRHCPACCEADGVKKRWR